MHKIGKSTSHRQCSCSDRELCSECTRTKVLKSLHLRLRSRPPNKIPPKRPNKLSQWYTRRKASNDLKSLYQKERQTETERRSELAQKERDKEVLEYLKERTSELLPPVKIEKKVHIKKRSASAPPRAKLLRPQVFVEEPRHLPTSIVLKHYTEKPTTVQLFDRELRWNSRRKPPNEAPVKRQNFCQWYKRRTALKELKAYNKNEHKVKEKNRIERARIERELEVYDLMRQRAQSLPPLKVKKNVRVQKRSASAKPRSNSRYVAVKTYNRYESLSHRFANCFYRICCQCYCYLTCIFLIVFFVIYIV